MRFNRVLLLGIVCFGLAASVEAQIGKRVSIQAGTPEDKALAQIGSTSDPAQKLALIDKFMADYGTGEMALVAYDLYISYYLGQKDYDKVFEYGDKLLALDPDNFPAAVSLVRAAQEKGDQAKLFAAGERVGAIVARYKAQPAPAATDPEAWKQEQARALEEARDNLNYVQYTLFNSAYQTRDPGPRAALLEHFLVAFPDSPYTVEALGASAATYQVLQSYPKMLDAAEKVLTHDANNIPMLLLLSDYYSETGKQLDKAEEDAKKALGLLESAKKPEGVSDEQWQNQVNLQKGLAWTALGQVHIQKNRLPQAVEAFKTASPLLKPDATSYGRNLYRLGFTLARMNRIAEARTVLTEAVSVDSPYKSLAQETLAKIGGARPAKKRP
jgi:tetratricopeptide (TPR) repeat protein